jgi:hypothetical protein
MKESNKSTRKVYRTTKSKQHNKSVKLPKDLIPDTSPPKTTKKNKIQNTVNSIRRVDDINYLRNRVLSQFKISDENITNFKRYVKAPNDCVINALQIIGIIDNFVGNMLRIAYGERGIASQKQIELIFTFSTSQKYKYHSLTYEIFVKTITENINPGHIVFAGYIGHVFLIGKTLNGKLVYIDPQTTVGICYLENDECEKLIHPDSLNAKFKELEEKYPVIKTLVSSKKTYKLLYNIPEQLSNEELRKLGIHID